jgi:hypothetical protein
VICDIVGVLWEYTKIKIKIKKIAHSL